MAAHNTVAVAVQAGAVAIRIATATALWAAIVHVYLHHIYIRRGIVTLFSE